MRSNARSVRWPRADPVMARGRTDSRDDFAYTIAKAAAGSYQFDFVVPAYQGWPGVSSLGSVRVGPAGAR